jgi:hypothetical protein
MNRQQRRRQAQRNRSTERIRELERRVETTGLPGRIHGLTDACADCNADGELILLPCNKVLARIYHDDGCPAHAGITGWKPAQP